MQLVVATYERFLLGYRLPTEQQLAEGSAAAPSNDNSGSSSTACVQLARSFTHAAHQGPVRCLDAGGPWLVSGGQDDQLHIYDVKAGKDLGFMMNPGDGAITCVRLFTPPGASRPTHLLSGSDDGSIAIWQAGGDWEALKLLRGHKGPIRGLSVHPSGKLAVSVGHDRLLKLWHLGKGRCSYSARLEVEADDVAFSADGEAYALLCDKVVSLHTVEAEGGLVAKLTHSRRVTAMLLPTPNVSAATAAAAAAGSDAAAVLPPLLLVGLDDGRLCLWDVRRPEAPVWELPGAHKARIRAITAVQQGGGPDALPRVLATASSDGVVKLWDSSRLPEAAGSSGGSSELLTLLGSVSTNGRITGMVLSAPEQAAAAAVNGGAVGGEAAAAAAAAKQKKKKAKKQQQQPQQQQQRGDAGEDGAVQKAAKTQRLQAAKQQQQQPSQSAPKQQHYKQAGQQKKQQQGKQKPSGKGKQQQGRQQQQQGVGDDPGFEVVPAPGGSSEAAPAAASPGQRPKQHKQKAKPSMKQQQQQQRGAAGGSDGALVPRVTTVIKKKKQRPGKPGVGAAAARAAKKGGKGGKAGSRRA